MGSHVKKIERTRLSDQIARQIMSLITKGKLKVGDRLPPEPVLMKEFGVGRSSLREAMGALSLMGIVSVRPGHGTHVIASPDSNLDSLPTWNVLREQHKVQELIEARIVLEEAAAGFAAGKADHKGIDDLKSKLAALELAKPNRRKYNQADLSFHMTIAKVGRNAILTRFLSYLRVPIRAWMERSTALADTHVFEQSAQQHKAILKVIEAKDAEKAKSLMRQHLEWSNEVRKSSSETG